MLTWVRHVHTTRCAKGSLQSLCGMLTFSTCVIIIIVVVVICVQYWPIGVRVAAVALSAAFTLRRGSSIRSLLHQFGVCLVRCLCFLVFFGSQAVSS